ncbi:MAG: kinase [Elusimicrobia bacterium]|nr:kinase [Elusimicrobiota bacterium]
MIISRTPFRISFFGGGTDYPVWYEANYGQVLATTINKYCYITCRYLPPFFEHKHRIVYSRIENVQQIAEIHHPSARACLQFMDIRDGMEIHHDGDLPARSGIGSSSAFTVGLLHALYGLKGIMPTRRQLATNAIHIEQDVLKENVGAQDQMLAAFGGFNLIYFGGTRHLQLRPVTLPPKRISSLQRHLMMFYTGVPRISSHIAQEQVKRTKARSRELKAICELTDTALEVLNGNRDITEFGRLLHEGWLIKRSLTGKISNPQIDEIYATARSAGALGGKILGAGGGGFILLFAKPEDQPGICKRLKKLLHVPFEFESMGSRIIFYSPSDPHGCEAL